VVIHWKTKRSVLLEVTAVSWNFICKKAGFASHQDLQHSFDLEIVSGHIILMTATDPLAPLAAPCQESSVHITVWDAEALLKDAKAYSAAVVSSDTILPLAKWNVLMSPPHPCLHLSVHPFSLDEDLHVIWAYAL
jgi:hypothetical protein